MDGITTELPEEDYQYAYEGNHSMGGGGMYAMHPAAAVIKRIILPIICACGITGIILTVIVLSRKNMCTSTNCYMMALAIADLLFLLLLASILIDEEMDQSSQAYHLHQIYHLYATILMNVFLLASIWLTVMLAIERYIAICRPFLAGKMCSVKKARFIIILIIVLALVCRFPNFWENTIASYEDTSVNVTIYYLEPNPLSSNDHYITVYPWIIDGVVASIVPFLLLLLLNARLIWEVRKSTQYLQRNLMVARNANSAVQREELQITIMLISVIIVFFVCQLPYVIYTAIVSTKVFPIPAAYYMLYRYIAILLLTLKSAVNFIIYCWFSEKFWMTLKKIFCTERCLKLTASYNHSQNGNYYHLRRFSSCATRESTI